MTSTFRSLVAFQALTRRESLAGVAPFLIALVAFTGAARAEEASSSPAPAAAPANGPTSFSAGLLPIAGDTIDNAFALNLGVGRYRSLRGLDLGLGGSLYLSDVTGAQVNAGVSSADGIVRGAQIAAGVAYAGTEVRGLQTAALASVTGDSMSGAQVSGLASIAGPMKGAQVAGLFTRATEVHGAQVSLITSAASVTGAQVALVNVAGSVSGAQVGLVNVAEDAAVSIGLVSWVKKGQHHVALTGSELGPSIEGKLGGTVVYTLYSAGFTPGDGKQSFRLGVGFGGHAELGERFFLEIEAIGSAVHESGGDWESGNVLATGRILAGFRVAGALAVVAGPTWNTFVNSSTTQLQDFGFGAVHQKDGYSVRSWPGVSAGLQF